MKGLMFFFLVFTFVAFAQIDQRADKMEKLLWWDLSALPVTEDRDSILADKTADDNITVLVTDTVMAELYVTHTNTDAIYSMDFVLQYGYYHHYAPNSYYGNILSLIDYEIVDSVGLGLDDETGTVSIVHNSDTKRFYFSYQNAGEGTGYDGDTSFVKLTFEIGSTAGQQILGVPLSEDVSRHGYTLRFWTELMDARKIPFSTWLHNAIIKAE